MNGCIIEAVHGRMVLDSRGRPTVEAVVRLRGGCIGVAIAPSGASKGTHEAVELRDGDKARFRGLGVNKAVYNVNTVIADALRGLDAHNQYLVDATMIELDRSTNKSMLGANATTAVSLAVAKAAACCSGLSFYRYLGGAKARIMPVPLMNIINGGVHAGNQLDFQEFLIAPVGAPSFAEALRIGVEIYWSLKDLLGDRYGPTATNVGDEGGFAPPMRSAEEALDALLEAIHLSGYTAGKEVVLGIDAAASQLYSRKQGTYMITGKKMSRDELIEYYEKLSDEYPILYLEDPLEEEDYEGFAELTRRLGRKLLVVGDDLYTTSLDRLRKGLEAGASNAVLVKINQVGTLTEALEFTEAAMRSGLRAVISHRSGETEDTSIADIAVALSTGLIKAGAPARGERTAKYNRLLRIEEELGESAGYLGIQAFRTMS